MNDKFKLLATYDTLSEQKILPKQVKVVITDNINPKFNIRPYQKEAFARLERYIEQDDVNKQQPIHLLFQMATGSGKTLVMAGAVLQLYQLGYRNFLFFVNNDNVLEKTRDNFLNNHSSKYLFADTITIDNKTVTIRECSNFDYVNDDDINICFTTIQKLHLDLQKPSENALNYEDFKDRKVVLLADEAHHTSGATKRGESLFTNDKENDEEMRWENTVMDILHSNLDNILLEFTATAELINDKVALKYNYKLLYNYSLKQFCQDKYSKDVQILQTDLPVMQRAVIACILNEYRLHVFADHKMNIKPVLMFKSKRATKKADDGTVITSSDFKEMFLEHIFNINGEQLLELANSTANNDILAKAFNYFRKQDHSLNNLAHGLKQNFTEHTAILIDSSNNLNKKDNQLVNSLESRDNHIRAVFAVDALNEGWDVLNLFDIVRLYNTVEPTSNKSSDKIVGKYTASEAQLIGRGARYCPFDYNNLSKYQRKFDNDLSHDLRICESLYYHSQQNSNYITQLRQALDSLGVTNNNETVTKTLKLKDSFKQSYLYKNCYVWSNKPVKGSVIGYKVLADVIKMEAPDTQEKILTFDVMLLSSNNVHVDSLVNSSGNDDNNLSRNEIIQSQFYIKDFCPRLVRKAIALNRFYRFSALRRYFIVADINGNSSFNTDAESNLNSITEFIIDDKFLANIAIFIKSYLKYNSINQLTISQQLFVISDVLKQLQYVMISNEKHQKGSKEFYPEAINKIFQDDKKMIFPIKPENSTAEYGLSMLEVKNNDFWLDLSKETCAWYAYNENYGTSEEKGLVKFMQDEAIPYLHNKYGAGNVFVLRNEQVVKLYNFDDDRVFAPDFVMFIIDPQHNNKQIIYQVFLEPKGEHLQKVDLWKQDFLQSIKQHTKQHHEILSLFENPEYRLLGLKFYNNNKKVEFLSELKQEI